MADKPPKTKARKIADKMENDRLNPNIRAAEKYIQGDPDDSTITKIRRGITGAPVLLGASGADMVSYPFREKRSEEDMSELTREVGRGMKSDAKRQGGKVSASSRADGIAQRGKTRGKMV
jgi:hypothetical protein